MASFLIPRHVYLCATDDGVVWLDTRTDRYSGMSLAAFHALRPMLRQGDPVNGDEQGVPELDGLSSDISKQLLRKGLLTRDLQAGKSFSPLTISLPRFGLPIRSESSAPRALARHVTPFLSACASTLVSLRAHSLYDALERARRKKREARLAASHDTELAFELMYVFARLRTYVYTARHACLYDSLTAFDFLARYGVFPDVVIGVRASPFLAHCWIQCGDSVLNGQPAYCAEFTPILAL
jgi:hypothetical protein